jgi:hypothetical protein
MNCDLIRGGTGLPTPRPLDIKGRPADWKSYRDTVADFVPDPMILRAGDVFLMGREQASGMLPQEAGGGGRVWQALDKNIHGILCFFDLLVTRDRIPLINYWHTFGANVFEKELGDRTVRVAVDRDYYEHVKTGALANLRRCKTSTLGMAAVRDVTDELDAFGWEWAPDLDGVKVTQERRPIAQFLLGGFVFGAYAQVSGTEHIIQSKRSRLFLALSAPDGGKRPWAYEREQKLFESLRDACRTEVHVRYEELPAAPSVVPHLMLSKPAVGTPRGLLNEVLEFRDSPDGKTYRQWWQDLRGGLARGHVNPGAERDITRVAAELNRRFGVGAIKASETRLSFEGSAEAAITVPLAGSVKLGGKVKVENLPVHLPQAEWLRRFIVENTTLRQGHSRVLLRLAIAQKEYENFVLGVRNLWEAG